MRKKVNSVTIIIAMLAVLSLFFPGFVYFKKMRIQTSAAITASTCFSKGFYLVLAGTLLVLLLNCTLNRKVRYISGVIAGITMIVTLYLMSNALQWLPLEKTDYSRLSLGPSMWLWLLCLFGVIVKINECIENKWMQNLLYLIPIVGIAILTILGKLNGLSIMIEYNTIKTQFWQACSVHMKSSALIVLVSIIIGIPIGYAANQHPLFEKIVFSIMNVIETIPGISFISILIIPLSSISQRYPILRTYGIKGFGIAPAAIALVLYALFPIIHNTRVAFKMVDDYYLEIAEALAMNNRQKFFWVILPMAMPTILSGIRIATVYTITGFVLAAFIGGGGLGTYMISGDSMDLIILGLIPLVIVTFIVDNGLKWIAQKISYGR